GARASLEEEYFSLQRLYDVRQDIVCDYLNYKRRQKAMSKTDLVKCFPAQYKHTVGHWLRKDFGGSIPTPSDWTKLAEILDIDDYFTNYVCKTALRLQCVKDGDEKLPDDFLEKDFLSRIALLTDIGSVCE
ncbi:MAG: hypothetical protein N2738_09740, partial [Thermodesulfovibrionales bacterium]|nr:hypothetical protein [Thermodesulfovibrionales bacterium]